MEYRRTAENEINRGFQRLYFPPRNDNIEDIENYRPGGFHPCIIGDSIRDFQVVHKLGFGGYSTVWLARDIPKKTYVAIKINTANAPQEGNHILKDVFEKCLGHPYSKFIDRPIEEFYIKGPNGKHLCTVSSLLGPSIAQLSQAQIFLDSKEARLAASQLTQCMAFLHSEHIATAHGDLTSSNVLLEISSIDHLSGAQIYDTLGEPVCERLLDAADFTGDTPATSSWAPRYIVEPIDPTRLFSLRTGNIRLIDFGEAFRLDGSLYRRIGTPGQFCSPELVVHNEAGKKSDIWALACTIFEMRMGEPLFTLMTGQDWEILSLMKNYFGPLPERLRDHRAGDHGEERGEESWTLKERILGVEDDKVGATTPLLSTQENTHEERPRRGYFARLKGWLSDILGRWWMRCLEYAPWNWKSLKEQEEDRRKAAERRELEAFVDLLTGAFNYDVGARPTAGKMLANPWLQPEKDL